MEVGESGGLFEISINTVKFNEFAVALNSTLNTHHNTLQQHTRELTHLKMALEDKHKLALNSLDQLAVRTDKKRKEDQQAMQEVKTDMTKLIKALECDQAQKIKQTHDQIEDLKAKLGSFGRTTREDILRQVEIELTVQKTKTQAALDREISSINTRVENMENEVNSTIQANNFVMKNILQEQKKSKDHRSERNSMVKNNSRRKHRNTNRDSMLMTGGRRDSEDKRDGSLDTYIQMNGEKTPPQMTRVRRPSRIDNKNNEQATQEAEMEGEIARQGRERRRRKMEEHYAKDNLQYASISLKVEALENRLTAKENQSINKVVYPTVRKTIEINEEISQSFAHLELQRKTLEQKITSKLENIERIVGLNYKQLQKELNGLCIKEDKISDEQSLLAVRAEKDRTKIAEVTTAIKRLEERKLDEKLIENLITMMRKQEQRSEQELDKRVLEEDFERENKRLNQRVSVLGESIVEKADKEEIRKAFIFIEDKIKQIVTVIAEEAQNEKEGALRRVPFKCLSCDKDIDTAAPSCPAPAKMTNRASTSHIRVRTRAGGSEGECAK